MSKQFWITIFSIITSFILVFAAIYQTHKPVTLDLSYSDYGLFYGAEQIVVYNHFIFYPIYFVLIVTLFGFGLHLIKRSVTRIKIILLIISILTFPLFIRYETNNNKLELSTFSSITVRHYVDFAPFGDRITWKELFIDLFS